MSKFDFETTFPPLDHPEHHFNKYPDHPWVKEKEKMLEWLKRCSSKGVECFEIHDDMTVSCKDIDGMFLEIIMNYDEYMPLQLREVEGLSIVARNLKSLLGTPYFGKEIIMVNCNLKSVLHLGRFKKVFLDYNEIESFKGMKDFEKKPIEFGVRHNPIKTYSEFTGCEKLYWHETNESKETYNILMTIQNNKVKEIIVSELLFDAKKILLSRRGKINMAWLNSILMAKDNKKEIDKVVKVKTEDKKRKL